MTQNGKLMLKCKDCHRICRLIATQHFPFDVFPINSLNYIRKTNNAIEPVNWYLQTNDFLINKFQTVFK